MKKGLFCFYFIFVVSLCSGCGYEIVNVDSDGSNIICFGNSITYGTGAAKGQDYPSILAGLLNRKVINAGRPGDTTIGALARIEKDVLERNPYLVIVELGGNDYLQQVPRERTLRNIEAIITKIQQKGAMVALCDISGGMLSPGFPHYRADFKKIARRKGTIFIPGLLERVLSDNTLRSDFIHPNAKGYRVIAEVVYKYIKTFVK